MSDAHTRRPGTLPGWLSRFRRPLMRAVLLLAIVIAAAFALIRVVAPFVISSGLVRTGIEQAVAEWTGHRVIATETPSLSFWPSPQLTLKNVTIEDPSVTPARKVAHIDRLSASFDLLDALGGDFRFNEFHLLRPHLMLRRGAEGHIEWTTRGLIEQALDKIRSGGGSVQSLDPQQAAEIGTIRVEDGRIDIADAQGAISSLAGINAEIGWPRLGGAIRVQASARVGGQDIRADFSSAQPLVLLAGRTAGLSLGVQAQPASARFEGTANLASGDYASGALEIEVTDVPGLIALGGLPPAAVTGITAATVSSEVFASKDGIRLNALNVTADRTSASGVIEFTRSEGKPQKLSGTLALNRVDIRSVFQALFGTAGEASAAPLPLADTLQDLDVDLRLSAQTAVFGPLEAHHLGASILATSGRINFDIGDSEFEGGQLIAHLATSPAGIGGDLDIAIRDADFAAAAQKLALTGPLPLGTGSLDLDLQISKPLRAMSANDVSGEVKLYTAPGAIPRLSLSAFRSLAASKPFFRLGEASGNDFDFDTAQITAHLNAGSADIRSGRITSRYGILTFTGLVPYGTSGMALAGTLTPADAGAEKPLQFFAGGSWPDPVISPVSALDMTPSPSLP